MKNFKLRSLIGTSLLLLVSETRADVRLLEQLLHASQGHSFRLGRSLEPNPGPPEYEVIKIRKVGTDGLRQWGCGRLPNIQVTYSFKKSWRSELPAYCEVQRGKESSESEKMPLNQGVSLKLLEFSTYTFDTPSSLRWENKGGPLSELVYRSAWFQYGFHASYKYQNGPVIYIACSASDDRRSFDRAADAILELMRRMTLVAN